jgi:hypothetical protein
MSSSRTVRNVLSRQGRYYQKATEFKKRVFPVFVIQLPYGVDLTLDGEKQVSYPVLSYPITCSLLMLCAIFYSHLSFTHNISVTESLSAVYCTLNFDFKFIFEFV